MDEQGQARLLGDRRFGPLFATQFFGALNDNVFRASLSLIFVYSGLIASENTGVFVNAAAGLFVLPFFLFSATAGQLADKYEKSMLIRRIKLLEIVVVLLGGLAVMAGSVPGMLGTLFLLGVQSALFGPLKFSILPQVLTEAELTGGNAQIEMGTFVAILIGSLIGNVVGSSENASLWVLVLVLLVAVAGYASSRYVPQAPPTDPGLRVNWNVATETVRLVQVVRGYEAIFLSILGISWFWLLGGTFVAQIPNLAKDYLYGEASVVTLILAVYTVAIATGSLMCDRLSGHKIEIGLVPFGAFGMTVAGVHLYFAIEALAPVAARGWLDFLVAPGSLFVLFDMAMVGVFGGLFTVPLYALIQSRAPVELRARVIAVNNIANALFMVAGSVMAMLFLGVFGTSVPEFMLMIAVMNIAVTAFIFHEVPEFGMRFVVWLLSHTMYRVTHRSLDNIPDEGAAVIVCNHITFVDALLLAGAVRRPIRFIMFKPIFDIPVLNFVFRTGRAIPIVGRREDERAYEAAFAEIRAGLAAGDLLCIFPEGELTRDGEIAGFRPGIERILAESQVPVVPMALKGLWGSFFSHAGGVFRNPSRFWSRVEIVAGQPVDGEQVTAQDLREFVADLRGSAA